MTYLPEAVLRRGSVEGETRGRTIGRGGQGSPSALCGNLVGGVQLAGGVMGPCGPT